MSDKSIIPIEFKWEKWDNYASPTAFLEYQNGLISYNQLDIIMESTGYKEYLKREIAARMKRHNPVLDLFNIGERQNPFCETSVDFFVDDKCIHTSNTPSVLTCGIVSDDDFPFYRNFVLPDGRVIEIHDKRSNTRQKYEKEDSDANFFTTNITLYKDECNTTTKVQPEFLASGEVDSENVVCLVPLKNEELERNNLVEDIYISYAVNAYNQPLSVTIRYDGIYLYISNCISHFSYSDSKRKRELSFVKYKTENIFQQASYEEETGIDSSIDGIVQIERDRITEKYSFLAGFDKSNCPSIQLPAPWASCYSHAIASHEVSKELMNYVLEKICERIPKFKQFIQDNFPEMIAFINGEKLAIPEIDEVFRIISYPQLSLNENGFERADCQEFADLQAKFDYIRNNRKRLRWQAKNKSKFDEKEIRRRLKSEYKTSQIKNSGD